jgi:hypothetical protein
VNCRPSSRRGSATGQVTYRVEDGRVTEACNDYDRLGMVQQRGLVPEEPTD